MEQHRPEGGISIHHLPFMNTDERFFHRGVSGGVMEMLPGGFITPRCRQERQVAHRSPETSKNYGSLELTKPGWT